MLLPKLSSRWTKAPLVFKPRLTWAEHNELGAVLVGVSDELLHRQVQLESASPRSGPEAAAGESLGAARDALEGAKREIEYAVFEERPGTASTDDYRPPSEDRAVVRVPAAGRAQRR